VASEHLTVGELLRLLEGDGSRHDLTLRALAHLREVSGSPVDLSAFLPTSAELAVEQRRRRSAEQAAQAAERRRAAEIAAALAAERRRAERDLDRLLDLDEAEERLARAVGL